VIAEREVQLAKARPSIDVMNGGNSIVEREVQSQKAPFFMAVTDCGSMMVVIKVQ